MSPVSKNDQSKCEGLWKEKIKIDALKEAGWK